MFISYLRVFSLQEKKRKRKSALTSSLKSPPLKCVEYLIAWARIVSGPKHPLKAPAIECATKPVTRK